MVRLFLTSLLLLGASCTSTRDTTSLDTDAVPTPSRRPDIPIEGPPPLGPGMIEAYVRVEACEAGRCQGVVVNVGDRGRDAPVLAPDQPVRFAVGATHLALRQGSAPAFRPGAVLHLMLSQEQAAGMDEGELRVADVRTPGLRSSS
jgi:hypothetical protein